ncbi:MAG: hypothetical protein ACRELA_18085 [Candidatus Rokuibacteriota bacterium]
MSEDERPESLSRQILDLLRTLGDPALVDYVKMLYTESPVIESEEDRLASESGRELTNSLMKQVVAIRMEPTFRGSLWQYGGLELPLETLDLDVVQTGLLDEYFTFEVLSAVPDMVSRWEKLEELFVGFLPADQRVTRPCSACGGKTKRRILPVSWSTSDRPPARAATGGMRHGRAYQEGREAA